MSTPKETTKQILRYLYTNANGVAAEAIKKHQGNELPGFGIMYPQIKELAQKYEPSNEIALELITKNTREARIFAYILSVPNELSKEQINYFSNQAISEELKNIFARHVLSPLIQSKSYSHIEFQISIELKIKALIQYFRLKKDLPDFNKCMHLLSEWAQLSPNNLNDGKHLSEAIYNRYPDKRNDLEHWFLITAKSNPRLSKEINLWRDDLKYL